MDEQTATEYAIARQEIALNNPVFEEKDAGNSNLFMDAMLDRTHRILRTSLAIGKAQGQPYHLWMIHAMVLRRKRSGDKPCRPCKAEMEQMEAKIDELLAGIGQRPVGKRWAGTTYVVAAMLTTKEEEELARLHGHTPPHLVKVDI